MRLVRTNFSLNNDRWVRSLASAHRWVVAETKLQTRQLLSPNEKWLHFSLIFGLSLYFGLRDSLGKRLVQKVKWRSASVHTVLSTLNTWQWCFSVIRSRVMYANTVRSSPSWHAQNMLSMSCSLTTFCTQHIEQTLLLQTAHIYHPSNCKITTKCLDNIWS